ncbi:MAG TPA: hypothetical protein VIM02_13235 [Rhizomicrobium sp.]|jgi:hypothetical protein
MNSLSEMGSRRLAEAIALSLLFFGIAAPAVQADVSISANSTHNMSCSSGVCMPTAHNAVLNADDVASMLSSGDLTVLTGSGANNIFVRAGFSWASASRLTLDAIQSVEIEKPVTVAGTGALTIATNDGGTGGDLLFAGAGSVSFWDLTSNLVIDGNSYLLERRLKDLARAIRQNKSGYFALAGNYNAQRDGTYAVPPIPNFNGTLEGLGHAIANLSIDDTHNQPKVGLISLNGGTVRDIGLTNADVEAHGLNTNIVGGLAAINDGTVVGAYVTGQVVGGTPTQNFNFAGGLVGTNSGAIRSSHAAAAVAVSPGSASYEAGGLVGFSDINGQIHTSYATGPVSASGEGSVGTLGGLVGGNQGFVEQSYATGTVTGIVSWSGGLVGASGHEVNCYATGAVTGDSVGGFAGIGNARGMVSSYSTGAVSGSFLTGGFVSDDTNETASNSYWDLDTSGVSDPSQGAGTPANDPGITGLSTPQFQSGLPQGFDSSIWGENPTVNGGFPYLRALPPR